LMTLPYMLEPKMTASWEKGLSQIEGGEINVEEFRGKLEAYVAKYVNLIKAKDLNGALSDKLKAVNSVYAKTASAKTKKENKK
ncbi:MAG: hypothetical protein IJ075_00675, partial [Lachnospiraceae bacterium]|nr:hypothetical protein [Lachnospiraceae bacterium]